MNKNIKDIGYILIDNIYRKTDQNKIKLFDKITKYNKIKKRSDTKKEKNAQYYLENYQNIRENNEELYNKYLEERLILFNKWKESNNIKDLYEYLSLERPEYIEVPDVYTGDFNRRKLK
jgi:hypothetical protein